MTLPPGCPGYGAKSFADIAGGVILAQGPSREALEERVREDPFVAEGVVTAEILAVSPTRTDERLAFLKG